MKKSKLIKLTVIFLILVAGNVFAVKQTELEGQYLESIRSADIEMIKGNYQGMMDNMYDAIGIAQAAIDECYAKDEIIFLYEKENPNWWGCDIKAIASHLFSAPKRGEKAILLQEVKKAIDAKDKKLIDDFIRFVVIVGQLNERDAMDKCSTYGDTYTHGIVHEMNEILEDPFKHVDSGIHGILYNPFE